VRKANELNIKIEYNINSQIELELKEKQLIRILHSYSNIVKEAGNTLSPAIIANYSYELAKEFNQFYHDYSILKEDNIDKRNFRLLLSSVTGEVIYNAMSLLGIEVPERM
jgi:arginyl-tRNA synthetase